MRSRPLRLSLMLVLPITALAEFSPPRAIAPATFRAIGPAWAGSSVNVVANRRHALFTFLGRQFAGYYAPDGEMILARRSNGQSEWLQHPTGHSGRVADAHNAISLITDGSGRLHVAWDHHGQPLNYARGQEPLSLELKGPEAMTGELENQVTYPEFYALPSGDLLALYRDGWSGRGRLILKSYSVTTEQWQMRQPNLIDGEGQRSPYWGASVDRLGRLHLAWIWRATPDVATNQDLAYAMSPDGGTSWQSVDGTPLQPPFRAATDHYAARIPPRHNLMNSPWVTTDDAGEPYLLSYWSATPEEPPQFRIVHRAAGAWVQTVATDRSEKFELAGTATKRPPISRGVLLVSGRDDQVAGHLVYRDDALGGRVVLRSTANLRSGTWHERYLTEDSVDAWEPVVDPEQWQRERRISLLVQAALQHDGRDDAVAGAPLATTIGVLDLDVRDLAPVSTAPTRSAAGR